METRKIMAVLLAAGALTLSLPLAACDDNPGNEIGESLEEAGKDTKRAVEDALD